MLEPCFLRVGRLLVLKPAVIRAPARLSSPDVEAGAEPNGATIRKHVRCTALQDAAG
jgi:hypothetical protein